MRSQTKCFHMHSYLLQGCIVVVTLGLIGAQRLDKTPLYPDGLTKATDLGPVLPRQPFKLSAGGQASDCTAPGGTEECQKIGKSFTTQRAIYSDDPKPITVCICGGSPYTAQSLADGFSQVSLLFTAYHDQVLNACMSVLCLCCLCWWWC